MRRIIALLITVAMIVALMALLGLPAATAQPVQGGAVLHLPLVFGGRPLPTPTATLNPILEGRDKPQLVSPQNGRQLSTLAPELAWRSAGEHWYGVAISTDPQFATLAIPFSPRSHCDGPEYEFMLMSNLDPATLYYWRVGYDDDTGLFTWSEVWWFTTPDPGGVLPCAPLPAVPTDGSTVSTLSPWLSWQGLAGVNMYHITLGVRDSLFTFSVLSPTAGQVVPFALLPGRTYAWNVRAFNGYGWGPQSTTWLFRTPSN